MARPAPQHLGFRGLQVLRFVEARLSAGKRAPSYAEIAVHLGFSSISDVGKVVRRLEKRGHLSRSSTGSRYRRGWHQPVIQAGA
jgi:SOS-response transcriptional repressor LexA